jgi:hypothetical protein
VVTEDDSTKPKAVERWIEGNLPGYRFGVVLTLLLVTFVFMSAAPTGSWVRVVTVALQGLTLLAALRASQVSRRLVRIAALVVVLTFLSAVGSLLISTSTETTGVVHALDVLMVAAAPVAIARALWRRSVVDVHTMLGAICIYVLVGMLFAFTYSAIGEIGSEPFFVQTSTATIADYLYFAIVTLTTVGYGDFTAAGGLGRSLASAEALLGQIYLVTVVAAIVSGMTRDRMARAQQTPARGDDVTR